MIQRMKEILQEDYLHWDVDSYRLHEDLNDGVCTISCEVTTQQGDHFTVQGEGVGIIDALFNALRDRLADDYPSLKSIRFSKFNIRGLLSSDDSEHPMTSQAEAEATVGIVNSEGKDFEFQSTAPSVSRAGVQATIQAAEYFVNSERTYVRLHEIIEHYREEGRTDLVEKYTEMMSDVVKNTSYSEVLEQIKNSM